ncbi:hypothetical protein MHM88_11260 [Epibacterium sp. MM17-32]|uniref:hypothetical protein n=1 Tax=Epibacterium sp. MM17-32 TaxID=2917734 RepID=UPI001EF56322|nr:hypothetical protein [Epibacterium sp. MM17-32]MCG7628386.1 hypothetical protein [Epibacterium sp. MM17-32]
MAEDTPKAEDKAAPKAAPKTAQKAAAKAAPKAKPSNPGELSTAVREKEVVMQANGIKREDY